MKDTKQIIVIRTHYERPDGSTFGIRVGKACAQASHASQAWITRRVTEAIRNSNLSMTIGELIRREAESEWLLNSFAKICCKAESELELLEINQKATEAGLEVHLIEDSGRTEFHGVPTKTCLCIGPDEAEKIDPITGHLRLL